MLVVCVVVRAVVFVLVGAQAFLVSDMARANVVMTILASASAAVVAMMMFAAVVVATMMFAAVVLASAAVVAMMTFAAVVLASAAVVAMMFGASAASMFGFQVIVKSIEIVVVHACGQNKFRHTP